MSNFEGTEASSTVGRGDLKEAHAVVIGWGLFFLLLCTEFTWSL